MKASDFPGRSVTQLDRQDGDRMLANEGIPDEYMEEIEERCTAATPGPWFVRGLDDDYAMNLVAVSTVEDTGQGAGWPAFDHREIVAATLVQHPRYVDCADGHWDENAAFIALAREAVPQLLDEVKRLRRLLAAGDA